MLSLPEQNELLNSAIQAANLGAGILRHNFMNSAITVRQKSDNSVVTNVDIEAESKIAEFLKTRHPDFGFEGEELGRDARTGSCYWQVDALEGTDNYILGFPYFATCVTLIRDDFPELGAVVNPVTNQLFTAKRGAGAQLNGARIAVNKNRHLSSARIAFIPDFDTKRSEDVASVLQELKCRAFRVLDTWAPTLDWCVFATGMYDGILAVSKNPFRADIGQLLATEAGAQIHASSKLGQAGGFHWVLATATGEIESSLRELHESLRAK